jgi:hypothetical protein
MKKSANYKEFVLHLLEYKILGISYGLNDLRRLARKFNCPIPKEYKQLGDTNEKDSGRTNKNDRKILHSKFITKK